MTSVSCSKDSEDTSAEENNTKLIGDIILTIPEELADFHEKGYNRSKQFPGVNSICIT